MQTTELIDSLAADLRPALQRLPRLLLAIAVGGALALAVLWLGFGFREDLGQAVHGSAFWMKLTFSLATAVLAFGLCARVARPESGPGWWLAALLFPPLFAAGMAGIEVVSVMPEERAMLLFGHSVIRCLSCIVVLAVPLLLAVLWAYRRFAPTRLRLAGFSGGLLAGAGAALVYSLHCTENSPLFIAAWYGVGMSLPAVLGVVLGPRVLRW